MQFHIKPKITIMMLLSVLLTASHVFAQLELESVYPALGVMGQGLQVTIRGSGFDGNTKVSMFMEVVARNPIIGSIDTPGETWAVTVVGDTAYVADGSRGLLVIDISNASNPQIIGSIDTPGNAYDVKVVGDRAYVADYGSGLRVIDISNPANPRALGSVDTPGSALGVAVVDNRAYVADYTSGLQVIDISYGSNPQILGSVDTPGGACGVTIVGDRAYVADYGSGLRVIDVSNPANPRALGSVDTPGSALGVAVAGNRAYVADYGSGVRVIDVSSPSRPRILGSVDTPGNAYDVKVVGNRAYVADARSGLQVIDVSNPAKPQILGSVDTPGGACGITIVGDKAYVADYERGLQVIDISNPANFQVSGSGDAPVYDVTPVPVNNPTSISVTLPIPQIAGHYTVRVFNGEESDELPDAVTFLTAAEYEATRQKKAILVAGGGPYAGNSLWEATQACANFAYLSLLSQGYTRGSIYYLSPRTDVDVDGDGLNNDIDDEATPANLSYAINVWAKDAKEVLIYMTDHGGSETFTLNGTKSPRDKIDAETLDAWLDDLQGTMPGKVIVIYDACNSGSFVSKLTPPAGKERIVITSTLSGQRAFFLSDDRLSFSYHFWASVYLNANLYVSYAKARDMMGKYQTALVDGNGNGTENEIEDMNLANNVIIGRGRMAASVPPSIGLVSQARTGGQTSAVLRAGNIYSLKPVARVWAVIIPPSYDSELSDDPVIDLPTVELVDPDQDSVYEGVYEKLNQWGTYRITFFVKDTENAYSLPKESILTQESGPDRFENDDTHLSASVIRVEDFAQRHNFHDRGDQDWVKFYAVAGRLYLIEADFLQSRCDAVIVLYDRDGVTRLTNPDPPYNEGDSGSYGGTESIYWNCPVDGFYYVMVKQHTQTDFGSDTGYDLGVRYPFYPIILGPGYIKGKISDALDVGVGGAVLRSNIVSGTATTTLAGTGVTTTGGYYLMLLPAGTYTVTAEAQGFLSQSRSGITVNVDSTTKLNFSLLPEAKKGDINNDNKIDLADLIIVLRSLTGLETTGLIRDNYAAAGVDVNGDNKVGIEEAIYILQEVSGLR